MRPTAALIKKQRALLRNASNLRCRVGGDRHWWSQREPLDAWKKMSGDVIAHQCVNCGAIKRVTTSPRYGERLSYRVWYPENYLLTRPEGWDEVDRLSSSEAVRMELREEVRELTPLDLDAVRPGGGRDGSA